MSADQSFAYPFSEFIEAHRHSYTQTGTGETGREFMGRWFAQRYSDPDERAAKFEVFIRICEYLTEYREQLAAAGLIRLGVGNSGDIVSGVLCNLLLNHFRVDPTAPYPEQVIAAERRHQAARPFKAN